MLPLFLAAQFLNEHLVSSSVFFKSPTRLLLECKGVLCKTTIRLDGVETILDFHVFEVHDFDILIGHTIKKLLDGNFNVLAEEIC